MSYTATAETRAATRERAEKATARPRPGSSRRVGRRLYSTAGVIRHSPQTIKMVARW